MFRHALQLSRCSSAWGRAFASTVSCQTSSHHIDPLVASFNQMSIKSHIATRERSSIQKLPYILPTLNSNRIEKITILDPVVSQGHYILPTSTKIIQEKVSPSLHTPDKIAPATNKSSYKIEAKRKLLGLITIRHKKMKKHKLKKLRKRMFYVWKREREIKARKKEKLMVLYEQNWQRLADEFNAEKYVQDQIDTAKKGGWGVNIFQSQR